MSEKIERWQAYSEEGPARGCLHSVCYEPSPPGCAEGHRCIVTVCGKDEAEAKKAADKLVEYQHALADRCERAERERDEYYAAMGAATTEIATLRAEVERLRARVAHCERCGGDYAVAGLNSQCACEEIGRLTDELRLVTAPCEATGGVMLARGQEIEKLRAELREAKDAIEPAVKTHRYLKETDDWEDFDLYARDDALDKLAAWLDAHKDND